ncbi:MAG TPA: MBOAT family O-acyltransferase, partial [Pirellulales bacterium]
NAPYQATSIAHFWRRWHMTLSRLLRDALYIPLGGNRVGPWRRSLNALIVMTIGGLWHGAGWTFILWGAAHGTFLAVNHAWSDLCKKMGWTFTRTSRGWKTFAWGLTFMCVSLTWVLFRAANLEAAGNMYASLLGADGFLPAKIERTGLFVTAALMAIAFLAPTTQRIMANFEPALDYDPAQDEAQPLPALARWSWSPSLAAALAVGAALAVCTVNLGGVQEFLYFNF